MKKNQHDEIHDKPFQRVPLDRDFSEEFQGVVINVL